MTKDFIIFIQFIIIIICISSILLNRYKTDKLLTSLENMIDSALKGSFTEKVLMRAACQHLRQNLHNTSQVRPALPKI